MEGTTIAVDLAKSVFEVAVSHRPGRICERQRLPRSQFLQFFANRAAATVVFEACGSAHYWGRQLQDLGHTVVLFPPHCVRPYRTRNKTDRADAKALLEALRNEEIHAVPVKSPEQQALGAMHRIRSGWMETRTARINTVRGELREFGIVLPPGARNVVPWVREKIEDADSGIPDSLRSSLADACEEIRELERRIQSVEQELEAIADQTPAVARLRTIPGVGLLTATALVAFVGNVHRFPSGRHLSSYLGLTPREHSTGQKRRLGAISKRGDSYLRMLLIHGARSVLGHAKRSNRPVDRLRAWALGVETLRGHNKAAVALANKMARIAWAVWKNDTDFREAAAA